MIVGKPCFAAVIDFVPAEMEILSGEELRYLPKYGREIGVSAFLAGIEGKIGLGRTSSAIKLGVGTVGRSSVPRHIDFGDNGNVALCGVSHNLTDIVLSIVCSGCIGIAVGADRADFGEFRIGLDLDAPALGIGKMPVEAVHLEGGHVVEQHLHPLLAGEMPGFVEHETAPGVARRVGDESGADSAVLFHLLHGLKAVEHSCFRSARNLDQLSTGFDSIPFSGKSPVDHSLDAGIGCG